jgi:hypothetical protein
LGTNDALTITTGLDVYTEGWTDWSSSVSLTGFSATSNNNVFYKRIGKFIFLTFKIDGTSNSTSTSMTLPFTRASDGFALDFPISSYNNAVAVAGGMGQIASGGSSISFFRDSTGTSWTNSGAKGVYGQIVYQSA